MPEIPNNIALSVQQPNAMTNIGQMLNFANTVQNMQRGSIALEKEKALLQPDIEKGKAQSATAQTESRSAAFKLQGEQATAALNEAAGLLQDPAVLNSDSAGTVKALADARKRMIVKGVPEHTADYITAHFMAKATEPGAVAQMLRNSIRANAGPQTQAGVINAPLTPVTEGQNITARQLQPGAEGAMRPGQSIQVTIPPSGVEAPSSDALGRPVIQTKDPNSGRIDFRPPQGSNYKPMMTLPPGETAETAKPLMAMRDKAQIEAARVPEERFNNQQILRLTPDAFTGSGSQQFGRVLSAVGIQKTNDLGADTAQLRHFLALQIQNNAAAQGANTDAARQIAERAVLPNDSPEKAVKAITRINDAYVTGKELFNKGMVAAINSPSNTKDIFAARDFQNAWAQHFDPNVMRLINADREGDKQEMQAISKELGEAKMKALLPKYRALKSLSEKGSLQ